MTNMLLREVG